MIFLIPFLIFVTNKLQQYIQPCVFEIHIHILQLCCYTFMTNFHYSISRLCRNLVVHDGFKAQIVPFWAAIQILVLASEP